MGGLGPSRRWPAALASPRRRRLRWSVHVANKKITANLKNLKRDLGKLEQRMFELQTQKHELEARLSTQTPPLSPQEIGELGLKLQTINDTLADCEDQWLLLSEQIEAES